jgi:serine/threonine protein phosphatase PrpC
VSTQDDRARRDALSPFLTADESRPLSARMRVEFGSSSHSGRMRTHNEDHFLILRLSRAQDVVATSLAAADVPGPFEEFGYAMLVADGLGKDGAGSVASRVALSTIAHLAVHHGKWNLRVDGRIAEELYERAEWYYNRADEAVVAKGNMSPETANIATALTAAYSAGADLMVAHVGHTRAYLHRRGGLLRLTEDHTIDRHLARIGRPVSVERRGQDLQHILTDAVGAKGDRPLVEVEQFSVEDGDTVLLCTNGLTDMVPESRIAEVLALRRRSQEQCETLTDLALAAGGEDNVTVVVAQYRLPPL